MSTLENIGLLAIDYTKKLAALRTAKHAIVDRMRLFDKTYNDYERVERHHPLHEQLMVFCFDQFHAKRRLMTAVSRHAEVSA
jgi:hypothetical protein